MHSQGGKPAVFALFLSKLNVDIHDVELLMAHTFKVSAIVSLPYSHKLTECY